VKGEREGEGDGWRQTGLPDFSWYNIPKRGKNIQNSDKMYQMAVK
jgi:hypothetical protein